MSRSLGVFLEYRLGGRAVSRFRGNGYAPGTVVIALFTRRRYDTLTAATALARGATLLTCKIKEFSRIDTLRLDNWYA